MEQGAIFFVAIVVATLAFFVSRHLREQRRAHWRMAAADHGLSYAQEDPFGTLDLGFRLFDMGDGHGLENVIHGTLDGVPIRAFDFWYWETRTDTKGISHRTTYRFCCAIAEVPLRSPHTLVGRENLFTRLADAVGFRDQEFESEEFNRAFQVRSSDARFASYLIDARMMEWLIQRGDADIELLGDKVLFSTRRMNPVAIGWLLERATGFCAQIPRVTLETYGAMDA